MTWLRGIVARDDTLYDSIIFASLFALAVLSVLAFFRPEVVMAYGGASAGIIVALGGAKCARDWKTGGGDGRTDPR